MSSYWIISWSREISLCKELPTAPVLKITTTIKSHSLPSDKFTFFSFLLLSTCFNSHSLPSLRSIVLSRSSSSTCRRGRPRSPRRRISCRVSTAEPSLLAASLRACAGSSRGTTKPSRWVLATSRYPAEIKEGTNAFSPHASIPNCKQTLDK